MNTPQVGDVWERDGKKRRVTKIEFSQSRQAFELWWNNRKQPTWCSTWNEWARKATLVERNGKQVQS